MVVVIVVERGGEGGAGVGFVRVEARDIGMHSHRTSRPLRSFDQLGIRYLQCMLADPVLDARGK